VIHSSGPPPRYTPTRGVRDEGFDEHGDPRAAFAPIYAAFRERGASSLERRWDEAQRAMRDHGLALAGDDDRGASRPFELDPVPLVIDSATWSTIERGVRQRARLTEAFLDDVYGERRLLEQRVLPPAMVLAHPQYARPCLGLSPGKLGHLSLYAADLVRGPDGRFHVVAEHTQTPPGAGYVLENRVVISRMLGAAFRDAHAQRLASFFLRLRETLADLAPQHRDNPRIVLLTAGAYSETYFEQAYLAQYFGISLVEGDDLTVRDERVFMKTLAGLEPVDVMLRRLADDYCDPLELRHDSSLGVLGLVGAVRAGTIALANAIGSGVAESPGLLAYSDALASHLLRETLILPSIESRWLGDVADPRRALDEDVILRAAFSNRRAPVETESLSAADRSALAAEIAMSPHTFSTCERLTPSTVPTFVEGALVPRPLSLRVFAVRTAEGFMVMPGGLARASEGSPALAFAQGGRAKDTWVIAAGAVEERSLLRTMEAPVELRRGGIDLPSRVADNLFWLGRYAERLEGLVRIVRNGLFSISDESPTSLDRALEPHAGMLKLLEAKRGANEPWSVALLRIASNPEDTLIETLQSDLRRTSASVRDRLSNDTWRALRSLDDELRTRPDVDDVNEAIARVDRIVLTCSAIAGFGLENTTRGPGFHFLDLGRRIERACSTLEIIRAALPVSRTSTSRETMEALLRVADSAITYRSRYLATMQLAPVLDLMLTDTSNPRSVGFQIERIADHVRALPRESKSALPTLGERLATTLVSAVTLADPHVLAADTPEAVLALDEWLARQLADLESLSDAVTTAYLTHIVPTRAWATLVRSD
jgi:uncharacterized circularly permuted ATP-grasp superfamily protein/uncharacterized alpha-E superfamily protein